MGRERYVIEAIFREGRSHRDVAAATGVSKAWVTKLVARYRAGGESPSNLSLAVPSRARTPPLPSSRKRSSPCAVSWTPQDTTPAHTPSTTTLR